MSEEEMQNKIRLDEARRSAVEKRLDKADGIRPNMDSEQKDAKRKKNYGEEDENKESKKYSGKFAKIAAPLAVAKKARDLVTAPTKIQAMDVAIYGIAISLALLKDLLDLAIGIIPGVVTVIGWCFSIAIGAVLFFDGVSSAQRQVARRLARRYLVLIAGTIVESLFFGLNYLPFETLTVFIIYWMSLMDRKR